MLKFLLVLLFIFQDAPPVITSPITGESLRGQVTITGNMNVTNFASAELAFAYASDPTSTWFTIQTFSSPVPDSTLFVWDTTALTDDDYTLRLRVRLQDGTVQEVLVSDLRILNEIPTETDTPTPESEATLPPSLPTWTPVAATALPNYPTPTPLPVNPAALTTPSIYSNFMRGTLVSLVLFFLGGIILRLRRP